MWEYLVYFCTSILVRFGDNRTRKRRRGETCLSCWRMLDGGEIARFLHLATRSRFVSTRKDAKVIPPWNEAVSAFAPKIIVRKKKKFDFGWCKCIPTKQPSKIRRNAMAASPSLKLVGHDGPDAAGACNERMLAPRTRDQRTTVCTQREVEEVGDDEWVGHQ